MDASHNEKVDLVRRAQEAEEQLSLALSSSEAGTWNWDMQTGTIRWDDFIHPLFGLSPGTFPGRYEDFEALLHPDDRQRVRDEVYRCIREDESLDIEFRVVWADRSEHVIASRGRVYHNSQREPVRMTGVCWDVTERNRQELELHAANERLSGVLNAATEMSIVSTDVNGIITTFNSGASKMLGYAPSEIIGKLTPKIIHDEQEVIARGKELSEELGRPVEGFDVFVAYAKRGESDRRQWTYIRKDGSRLQVRLVVTAITNDAGETAGFLGIAEDITSQLEAMEAMRQAKEDAESANRAKSSFLANMSHEIRTPMNGILGMTQLVSQSDLDDQQQAYVRTIHDSAQVLLRLLNDILDFSKIEAGKLELVCEPFQIGKVVAHAARMFSLKAREKAIEIVVRIAPQAPTWVIGDADRLQQVLVNLIGNAVKFTRDGEIFVDVDVAEAGDSRSQSGTDEVEFAIEVTDSGIGIEPQKLTQIFQPFVQAESTTTRRFGGTGLGLAISKQIVQMMRGRISAKSRLGEGATFRFTARMGIPANPLPSREAKPLSQQRVLVVDDNSTSQRVLREWLHHWQTEPIIVDTVEAGQEKIEELIDSASPIRIVLLDSSLPPDDIAQFIAGLSALQSKAKTAVILMVSGAESIDADLVRKSEQCRYLPKPAAREELLTAMLEALDSRTVAAAPGPLAELQGAAQRLHVLLVEDNEVNRRVAIGLLHRRGHSVSVAVNGREAVDLVAGGGFEVVLMDIQMPVMDGIEATLAIRQAEPPGQRVPIVAMTADALQGVREKCLEVGMDDYVTKPVSPTALYQAVESLGQSGSLQTAATPASPAAAEGIEVGDGADGADGIDWPAVRKRLPGGEPMLEEFIRLADQDTRRLFDELLAAIQVGDAKSMQRAAHTIKSTARHFGYTPVADAAFALEAEGRDGTTQGVATLVDKLREQLDHFYAALKSDRDG